MNKIEFAEEATKISKIIIEELFFEKEKRTIKPIEEKKGFLFYFYFIFLLLFFIYFFILEIQIKGIAGGIKYEKNGIFFKLR